MVDVMETEKLYYLDSHLSEFDAVCLASPAAWVLADCFLIPAYLVCIKRRTKEAEGHRATA